MVTTANIGWLILICTGWWGLITPRPYCPASHPDARLTTDQSRWGPFIQDVSPPFTVHMCQHLWPSCQTFSVLKTLPMKNVRHVRLPWPPLSRFTPRGILDLYVDVVFWNIGCKQIPQFDPGSGSSFPWGLLDSGFARRTVTNLHGQADNFPCIAEH